jgi:diaminopimelate epimerase
MKISFTKMHGAGNDFMMVDDRALTFPVEDTEFIQRISARSTGIGCDGVILLQPSSSADLNMRFINPDGGEQDMCGNGARCFARLAYELGAASEEMTIETRAGLIHANVMKEGVSIQLTDPMGWRMNLDAGLPYSVDFVNTGVPHAVLQVEDLSGIDLPACGSHVRYHALFAPEGTNVNFVKTEADATLSVRTYERGVEAETLACGTGAAAVAWVAVKHGWSQFPVTVHCAGGFDLVIDSGTGGTTLSGGAEKVFEGEVEYGNRI